MLLAGCRLCNLQVLQASAGHRQRHSPDTNSSETATEHFSRVTTCDTVISISRPPTVIAADDVLEPLCAIVKGQQPMLNNTPEGGG